MAAEIPEATYEAFPRGGGVGSALPKGFSGRRSPGGQPRGPQSKAVRLALAVTLLWLAGFCFFIAFSTKVRSISRDTIKTEGGPNAVLDTITAPLRNQEGQS